MAYPSELKYTEGHEWVKVDGDTATIGITSYATEELGDIVFVDMPGAGVTVASGDTFGTIESVKTVADLSAPVSGEIVATNQTLEDTPETVNEAPYLEGWIVKIRMSNPAELDALLSSVDYAAKL